MTRLVDEFRAIPWNARGRRIGHTLQGLGILILLMAPVWFPGMVIKAVGP